MDFTGMASIPAPAPGVPEPAPEMPDLNALPGMDGEWT
jgi:hypothetical protein